MLELDGSAGGGQLLRSALTCSLLTGEGFTMTNVRGDREEPGLKAQHHACVELAAAIGDADVDGARLGSERVRFVPDRPSGGAYEVDVGTAGSVPLVFDVALPLATAVDRPLRVTATGGTAVPWAPPLDFHRRVKLPLLRRVGLGAAVEVDRPGYHPVGGGSATLTVHPSSLDRLEFREPGEPRCARVFSTAAASLSDADVPGRQADAAAERLADDGWDVAERTVTAAAADCAGSSACVRLDYTHGLAGGTALGAKDKPAEEVGVEAAEDALSFAEGPGAVDRYLGDQLLVFLALSGGAVAVPEVTDHVDTNVDMLDAFGYDVRLDGRTARAPVDA